jgi:hypothetical protein
MNDSNKNKLKYGFIIAGLMNFSVLVFSKFFTNPVIVELDPAVMSDFGLLMIMLWGVAYISINKSYQNVKWLVAVFAIEKIIYGINWINWLMNNSLSDAYEKDLLAGMFYSIYGLNDWIFFIFFTYVFISISKK